MLSVGIVGSIVAMVIFRARADADCTALWSSAESGENLSVQDILEKGADPNCQGGKPIRRAKIAGYQDTVELLKSYGAKE